MASSWKLRDDVARDTQGIVASGFGRLEMGSASFLELPEDCGGAWLTALNEIAPVTSANLTEGPILPFAVSLSFTASGLVNMGVDKTALSSFSAPFREGMMQADRLRRLGDRRKAEWRDTVIDGGPVWSGNTQWKNPEVTPGAYEPRRAVKAAEQEPEEITTAKTVHAMLLLYAQTVAEVDAKVSEIETLLNKHGVKIVHQLPLVLDAVAGEGFSREHFGFADGISQPLPYDEAGAVRKDGKDVKVGDKVHGVRLGEILFGYKNGHQEIAPGPVVQGGESSPLPQHKKALGFHDLGKNGSYVVVRQLRQDVAAFWTSMEQSADTLRKQDPKATDITPTWVAEKVVGRGIDGRGLRPGGRIPNGPNGEIKNDFMYFDEDRHGVGCPLGSHVRRANPRDSLAPKPEMKQVLHEAANNHRILRRARKYGPKLEDQTKDDGKDRGLLFICLNTDITRQFEFTQQTWLLNSDFSTLFEETDPLVGPDGTMTIPEEGLRRRAKVQTFVKLVGGEFFFLPSLPALQYLASLST